MILVQWEVEKDELEKKLANAKERVTHFPCTNPSISDSTPSESVTYSQPLCSVQMWGGHTVRGLRIIMYEMIARPLLQQMLYI
jgi:hypothetical protein